MEADCHSNTSHRLRHMSKICSFSFSPDIFSQLVPEAIPSHFISSVLTKMQKWREIHYCPAKHISWLALAQGCRAVPARSGKGWNIQILTSAALGWAWIKSSPTMNCIQPALAPEGTQQCCICPKMKYWMMSGLCAACRMFHTHAVSKLNTEELCTNGSAHRAQNECLQTVPNTFI